MIKNYIFWRNFDAARIEFVKNGYGKKIKTELWIDL